MTTLSTHSPAAAIPVRTDAAWLDAHWMPFTANRQFKADPRLIVEARGAYYTDHELSRSLSCPVGREKPRGV